MSRMKIFLSLAVIVLAVTLVGGATLAWFTAETDPIENVFTAGTIEIEAGGKMQFPNWNPGDGDEVEFCVKNTGTKNSRVRLNLEDALWNPGPLRILVLYTNNDIQLIGVEWATFCQGCTGTDGPMATGSATYSYSSIGGEPEVKLVNDFYFGTVFSNLQQRDDNDWLDEGITYAGWCLDNQVTIDPGTYTVQIFDPFCNPNWVNDTDASGTLKTRWENIDFNKISYIINHDFLSRGYISVEIQQAIWNYTNGQYHNSRYYLGNTQEIVDYIDGIAVGFGGDIIAALNDIDNVDWEIVNGDWTEEDGYIYYNGILEPGDEVCFTARINLSGLLTGNEYQGMDYKAAGFFEAVQSSNFAPYYEWGTVLFGTPQP